MSEESQTSGIGRDMITTYSHDHDVLAFPQAPTEGGGYGLALIAALAARWGGGREDGLNVTWFELDPPSPGSYC
jgi:hypothetical protein